MKKKLTKKDQIFISGLIFIGLIVFLFFVFVVKPMVVQLMAFDKEEKNIKEKLKNAEKFAADRENLTAGIKDIEKKIAFYEERLPKEVDIPIILDRLIEIGKKSVVSFVAIEPQPIMKIKPGQDNKIYLKIPIEIKLKAGYHEFAAFVNGVERLKQFMRVDNVKILADKKLGRQQSISLTISAFAVEEEGKDAKVD